MQRHQQRRLQEAQPQHQIDPERRRQRVTLKESLHDRSSRFRKARVIDGHAHQPLGTVHQGALENRLKQGLGLPRAAGMEKILRTPAAALPAIRPDDPRQTPSPHSDQRAERLTDGAAPRARLREDAPPLRRLLQEGGEQRHGASGRRPNVFFSVRTKRSPRATFLVSEETRLSRSTVTPKVRWIRDSNSETCSGVRAFLSTS